MATTNAQILGALSEFRRDSERYREAMVSGINDLNTKFAVQNGRVGTLEKTLEGPEGHSRRIRLLERSHWKLAGAVGAFVGIIEVASHYIKNH